MVTFTALTCYKFIFIKPTSVPQTEKVITVVDREMGKKEKILHHVIDYIRYENKTLKGEEMRNISELVYDESRRYKLDYRLVLSLMKVESNFRHNAISKKGARGLLQVKPSLARYVAEDAGVFWQGDETLDEPEKNIKIGVYAFSRLIKDFKNITMALHAYHVGPAKLKEIISKKKIPKNVYLNLVLDEYDRNVSLLPAPSNQ
jgi:soluble lytic murein transglycosylase